eukprot:m.123869 g.123869  ORF g.123869 m.123869 type:complete len:369 (+) comp29018_c0_seq1:266-1372(+)
MFAGFILAGSSALFNGSFAIFSKFGGAKNADPVLFNLWLCCGVFLSSMLSAAFFPLTGNEFGITAAGTIGGALLVLATLFSFLAIPRVGLAVGQGVWGATAIVVAFLWGCVGPVEIRGPLQNTALSVVSLLLLTLGIIGILYSERVSSRTSENNQNTGDDEHSHNEEDSLIKHDANTNIQTAKSNRSGFALGLLFAFLVGIFGGSILVPLSYVGDEAKYGGIGFLPSFGLGALVFALAVTMVWAVVNRVAIARGEHKLFGAAPMGIVAGVVWNLGNVCSILSMGTIGGLSYGIAYPFTQCALLISGLWGIFFFREITGRKAISIFFVAALVLLGGAAVLGVYGPRKPEDDSNTSAPINITNVDVFSAL